jgi:dethiobiotin synthetase
MTALFVSATGTDIGKTYISAAIAKALRAGGRTVEALKPVISGFEMEALADSDTGILLSATGLALTPENADAVSPWRFRAPLSPDMAAAREGRTIDFGALASFCLSGIASRKDVLLIEGVGGVMVPLDDRHTVLDWMAALEVPVLLVAGSYLGSISHTLTALDVIGRRGIRVMAVVISETPASTVDLAETARTVRRFAGGVPVTTLGRDGSGTYVVAELLPLLASLAQSTSPQEPFENK